MPIKRPSRVELSRGGPFGEHVRPSDADDVLIRALVETIFTPTPPWTAQDPRLVQQLLDRAPRPGAVGDQDFTRTLRADEIADITGAPLEGLDLHGAWLARADEVARAWGRGLYGAGGLLEDLDTTPTT